MAMTVPTRMEYIRKQGLDPLLINSWISTTGNNMPGVGTYWWGEPVYGFYNPKDKYVVRKQKYRLVDFL